MTILRRIAWRAVYFVLGVTGVATFGGFLSDRGWLFDVMAAFRPVYLAAQAGAGILLFVRRRWLGAAAALLLIAANAQQVLPLYLSPKQTPVAGSDPSSQRLRVLQLNSHIRNSEAEKVLAYAKSIDADLFAVEEVSKSVGKYLEQRLSEQYPFLFTFLADTGAGIALFSKYPLLDPQLVYFADPGLPSIVSKIHISGADITVVVTHPLSPTTPYGYRLRNRQLRAIAETRKRYSERLIVIGDLNVTSWSSIFSELTERAGLLDTRRGFGTQPTWPKLNPGPFALAPIDHCLVSPHFRIVSRRVGPDVGSDHLPIIVDLELIA
ncbi:MAG: hypothetical protein C4318_01350 [Acidimicrobiia bacterium]